MSYRIFFTPYSRKQFEKLPFEMQQRIRKALDRIKIRPKHFLLKLVYQNGYRFRVGDYRIILEIQEDKLILLVIKIAHRKVVCRSKN
jgi:mRNA interferase RelE/StbE